MAAEAKRGCGYRKVGGLYLRSDGVPFYCPRLPFALGRCERCGHGIRAARVLRMVRAQTILSFAGPCPDTCSARGQCALANPGEEDEIGLMLVSNRYYTPTSFQLEAQNLGVSKRIAAIPRKLKLHETWVLLAMNIPANIPEDRRADFEGFKPGTQSVFYAFQPTRIELVVTPTWKAAHAQQVEYYQKRGVVLVEVPDDDPDHQPRAKRKPWEESSDAGSA